MLPRNLEQNMGLCNGTRLQVKNVGPKTLDCRVLGGEYDGKQHYIPRIPLAPPDSNGLFAHFRRIQFPVRLVFNLTINKSQGQSLQHVGLCLHPEVFAHGQLYVALSRVTSKNGLSIVAPGELPRRQPLAPARGIRVSGTRLSSRCYFLRWARDRCEGLLQFGSLHACHVRSE